MDEVARWLVDSAHLPQYEQAFRDHEVDGDVLLDLVARDVLGQLVESQISQSRIRGAVAKYARRASAGAAAEADVGEAAGGAPGARRAGPGEGEDERPRQRRRLEEPPRAEPAAAASPPPLVAVTSPSHGTLVYARTPLADLEVRARRC